MNKYDDIFWMSVQFWFCCVITILTITRKLQQGIKLFEQIFIKDQFHKNTSNNP